MTRTDMSRLPTDKNRRVLVIDDNRSIHDDFRKILAPDTAARSALDATEEAIFGGATNPCGRSRFEVDSAYQGQEGVTLARRAIEGGRPYAMAFVDIRMPPGWDGVETTLEMWKIDPDIQIVICTAFSDYSWDEMFKRIGNCDGLLILKKPFDTVEALQLAHALTAKWSLHQQATRRMEELERMVGERTHELQQSEQRFRQVAESAGEWIWEVDADGLYRYCSSAVETMLGYTPDELVGQKHFYDLFAPEMREGLKTGAMAAFVVRAPFRRFENRCLHKNGTTVILETSAAPILDLDGKGGLLGYRGTDTDITERKRLEAQLRQQQNLASVGTLARGMAHEINNPIMGVMNYAELIKDRAAGNAPLVEFADEILAEGRRVARMTQSLLGFTEQKADPVFAPATLADLMADVLPPAAAAAREKGIALSCDIPADLPPVSCRRSQLDQVVTALLADAMEAWPGGPRDGGERKIALNAEVGRRNADGRWERGRRKAEGGTANAEGREEEVPSTPPSSEFGVRSSEFGVRSSGSRRVRLTVEDNGPGIPEAIRERVFDPFFTTKDRTRHSGLGLWISRFIIQGHGGELSLESEAGKGTRVHVDLPVEEDA